MGFKLGFLLIFLLVSLAGAAQAQTDACQAAEREMIYGETALADAKDKKGFLESARQFQAAAAKAPNCARAHFNLGLVYEKAGEYKKAVGPLLTYLKLLPNAADADQVRRKIIALEYRVSRAARARAEQPSPTPERPLSDLNGKWCGAHDCVTINVFGNSFEASLFGWCDQKYHGRYVRFKGVIDSQLKITGQRLLNCPNKWCQPTYPMTGSISRDFRKMRISVRTAQKVSRDFCRILEYSKKWKVESWTKR